MLASIEYSWPEKLRFNRAAERSFNLLYPDLLSVNLSETVPQVEVPVFFAEGQTNFLAERMGAWLSDGIEPHAIG